VVAEDPAFDQRVKQDGTGRSRTSSGGEPATYEVITNLRDQGYTFIDLYTGGTANGFKVVAMSILIQRRPRHRGGSWRRALTA